MKAELLSVGTELLLGYLVDTNAPYLAGHLATLGIDLYWISQLGDNRGRLTEAFRKAWGRADLIVVTGGLGPTEDDVTREAISDLLSEQMTVIPELEAHLRQWFADRGVPMPETNLKQATLIPSAQAIPNPRGTAPGWWVEKDNHIIVAMPGVPFEMKRMWTEEALPRLRQRQGSGVIFSRTLKVFGIGEGAAENKIQHLIASNNPTAATYAKDDGVHVRLTAKATSENEAQTLVDELEGRVRAVLGSYVYGYDEDTLEGVVADLLQQQGLTVATVEQCTGGLLSCTLTNTPHSEGIFKGGLLAGSLESRRELGMDESLLGAEGIVSERGAIALAALARRRWGADIGLATVGVPGPQEVEGKRVGTMHYAVDNRGVITTGGRNWASTIPEFRRRCTLGAVNLLRRSLLPE